MTQISKYAVLFAYDSCFLASKAKKEMGKIDSVMNEDNLVEILEKLTKSYPRTGFWNLSEFCFMCEVLFPVEREYVYFLLSSAIHNDRVVLTNKGIKLAEVRV